VKRLHDRGRAGAWCTIGGTANAITLTYAVAPASYVQGEKYAFKATAANTGATTVNVNGLGAKSIFRKNAGRAATQRIGGEIQNGDLVELEYDGTQFQILGGAGNIGTVTSVDVGDQTNGGLSFSGGPVTSSGAIAGKLLPSDLLTKTTPTLSDSVMIMDAA